MVYHSSAPFAFYSRDPTTAAQPPKSAPYSYSTGNASMPSLPQLDAMLPGRVPAAPPTTTSPAFPYPTNSTSSSSGYGSPAACMPLEWPSPAVSPSSSSTLSTASSPVSSPSPPPSLTGQPVLSDDQLLQEMFQRSATLVRRFPSLSMDDAVLCGQMLGLPAAGYHPHHHSANTSFLSMRGLSVPPPALAIPSPMGYNRAFSSPPMLSSSRRQASLSAMASAGRGSLSSSGLGKKKVPASRICRMPGCTKGIRSRGLCKAHGGGRRCQTPGCEISDQGGGHCIAHGGGRRCSVAGCLKSAQSKGLCKLHGGARLCRLPSCSKNGQIKGLCRLHYSLMVASAGSAGASASVAGRRV